MKIQKFNENNNSNWNDAKMKKYAKMKGELEDMKDSIERLLLDYLELNPNLQEGGSEDLITDESYINFFGVHPNHPYTMIEINYFPSSEYYEHYNAEITQKQYPDFLEFLANPDLYEKTKKYNL